MRSHYWIWESSGLVICSGPSDDGAYSAPRQYCKANGLGSLLPLLSFRMSSFDEVVEDGEINPSFFRAFS